MNITQDMELWTLVANASLVVKAVMVAAARRFLHVLDVHLPQMDGDPQRARADREVRARVLERQRPQRALPGRGQRAPYHRQPGAHLRGRLPRVHQAARAAQHRRLDHGGRRAPRDARDLPARDGPPREPPLLSRLDRLGEPLRGPVRHGLGHHACLPQPGQRAAGDAGAGRARHRRGADRHRDRPVRGDPRGGGLQPLFARHRPPRDPLRELHGGVLQHPAAADGEASDDGAACTPSAAR